MTDPSNSTVLAWARLLRAHHQALTTVEGALKTAGHPPLEWYDVLLELERTGPMRPRDLRTQLLLAQSNVSRLLDRMEASGATERHPCDDDGRGYLVAITQAGRALRRRMWPTYAAAIETAVGEKLGDNEREMLAALLSHLIVPARPSAAPKRKAQRSDANRP